MRQLGLNDGARYEGGITGRQSAGLFDRTSPASSIPLLPAPACAEVGAFQREHEREEEAKRARLARDESARFDWS